MLTGLTVFTKSKTGAEEVDINPPRQDVEGYYKAIQFFLIFQAWSLRLTHLSS